MDVEADKQVETRQIEQALKSRFGVPSNASPEEVLSVLHELHPEPKPWHLVETLLWYREMTTGSCAASINQALKSPAIRKAVKNKWRDVNSSNVRTWRLKAFPNDQMLRDALKQALDLSRDSVFERAWDTAVRRHLTNNHRTHLRSALKPRYDEGHIPRLTVSDDASLTAFFDGIQELARKVAQGDLTEQVHIQKGLQGLLAELSPVKNLRHLVEELWSQLEHGSSESVRRYVVLVEAAAISMDQPFGVGFGEALTRVPELSRSQLIDVFARTRAAIFHGNRETLMQLETSAQDGLDLLLQRASEIEGLFPSVVATADFLLSPELRGGISGYSPLHRLSEETLNALIVRAATNGTSHRIRAGTSSIVANSEAFLDFREELAKVGQNVLEEIAQNPYARKPEGPDRHSVAERIDRTEFGAAQWRIILSWFSEAGDGDSRLIMAAALARLGYVDDSTIESIKHIERYSGASDYLTAELIVYLSDLPQGEGVPCLVRLLRRVGEPIGDFAAFTVLYYVPGRYTFDHVFRIPLRRYTYLEYAASGRVFGMLYDLRNAGPHLVSIGAGLLSLAYICVARRSQRHVKGDWLHGLRVLAAIRLSKTRRYSEIGKIVMRMMDLHEV